MEWGGRANTLRTAVGCARRRALRLCHRLCFRELILFLVGTKPLDSELVQDRALFRVLAAIIHLISTERTGKPFHQLRRMALTDTNSCGVEPFPIMTMRLMKVGLDLRAVRRPEIADQASSVQNGRVCLSCQRAQLAPWHLRNFPPELIQHHNLRMCAARVRFKQTLERLRGRARSGKEMVPQAFPLSKFGLAGRALRHAVHRMLQSIKPRRYEPTDGVSVKAAAMQVQAALSVKRRIAVATRNLLCHLRGIPGEGVDGRHFGPDFSKDRIMRGDVRGASSLAHELAETPL